MALEAETARGDHSPVRGDLGQQLQLRRPRTLRLLPAERTLVEVEEVAAAAVAVDETDIEDILDDMRVATRLAQWHVKGDHRERPIWKLPKNSYIWYCSDQRRSILCARLKSLILLALHMYTVT